MFPRGITFDDVLLVPAESDVVPSEVSTASRITRNITVQLPLARRGLVASLMLAFARSLGDFEELLDGSGFVRIAKNVENDGLVELGAIGFGGSTSSAGLWNHHASTPHRIATSASTPQIVLKMSRGRAVTARTGALRCSAFMEGHLDRSIPVGRRRGGRCADARDQRPAGSDIGPQAAGRPHCGVGFGERLIGRHGLPQLADEAGAGRPRRDQFGRHEGTLVGGGMGGGRTSRHDGEGEDRQAEVQAHGASSGKGKWLQTVTEFGRRVRPFPVADSGLSSGVAPRIAGRRLTPGLKRSPCVADQEAVCRCTGPSLPCPTGPAGARTVSARTRAAPSRR